MGLNRHLHLHLLQLHERDFSLEFLLHLCVSLLSRHERDFDDEFCKQREQLQRGIIMYDMIFYQGLPRYMV